jgi:hypothetical protein
MSSAGTSKLHLPRMKKPWCGFAVTLRLTAMSLAAALAQLGRMDEGCAAAKAGLDLEPSFSIARFRAGARSENPVYVSGRERIYEGRRRAGIPK